MKREFLKGLGIEDSGIIDRILDENGADLSRERAKFGDYETIRKRAEDAEERLKAFEGVDVDAIIKERDNYKEQSEKVGQDKDAEIAALKLDYEISRALTAAGARNDKAVKALLDDAQIKLEDGKVIGLDEQLEKLRADNGYLFNDSGIKPQPKFAGKSSGAGGEFTKEAFDKMSYHDRIQLKHDNPEIYETLRKE